MLGVIERIKNNVLLKCSTLNENVVSRNLEELISKWVYHFAEDFNNLLNDLDISVDEKILRDEISNIIEVPVLKKVKRKLFIDSLAIQITNDSFVEDYLNNKITLDKINKKYVKELNKNKNTNQLNMTEDLDTNEMIQKLREYLFVTYKQVINGNISFKSAISNLISEYKVELDNSLKELINSLDNDYLNILLSEIEEDVNEADLNIELDNNDDEEIIIEEFSNDIEEQEGKDDTMFDVVNNEESNKFEKYDDITLFNKMILSLNTKEEKLSRKEKNLETRKGEIEDKLTVTNKNIEANIERENLLSQRKIELNGKEVELNSKLSETEVIFLNIKPLIKGLNKIKGEDVLGGGLND